MKKRFFIFFSLFICLNNYSQSWQWARSGNGPSTNEGYFVACDVNGNSYLTGYFYGPTTITFSPYVLNNTGATTSLYFVKYGPTGNILWAKGASGTGDCVSSSVSTDSYGNSYLTGAYDGTLGFGAYTVTGSNMFLTKYSPSGSELWVKTPGIYGYGNSRSVHVDKYNRIYQAGSYLDSLTIDNYTAPTSTNPNVFIARYDTSGNPVYSIISDDRRTRHGKLILK